MVNVLWYYLYRYPACHNSNICFCICLHWVRGVSRCVHGRHWHTLFSRTGTQIQSSKYPLTDETLVSSTEQNTHPRGKGKTKSEDASPRGAVSSLLGVVGPLQVLSHRTESVYCLPSPTHKHTKLDSIKWETTKMQTPCQLRKPFSELDLRNEITKTLSSKAIRSILFGAIKAIGFTKKLPSYKWCSS